MSSDCAEVMKAIQDLKREMRAELRSVHQSLEYSSNAADEFKKALTELRALTSEVKKAKEDYAELKKENNTLTEKLMKAEARISELEQYSRLNNVEIKGLPATVRERAHDMAIKIAEAIEVPLDLAEIDIAHSVPTKKENEVNIIVRFMSRSKRNVFLAAAKKLKLSTSKIGFEGPDQRVYVNEHLTPENKRLLGATISRKKQVSWKHVWTRNGAVFARKTDDSNVLRIYSLIDLSKMT